MSRRRNGLKRHVVITSFGQSGAEPVEFKFAVQGAKIVDRRRELSRPDS